MMCPFGLCVYSYGYLITINIIYAHLQRTPPVDGFFLRSAYFMPGKSSLIKQSNGFGLSMAWITEEIFDMFSLTTMIAFGKTNTFSISFFSRKNVPVCMCCMCLFQNSAIPRNGTMTQAHTIDIQDRGINLMQLFLENGHLSMQDTDHD